MTGKHQMKGTRKGRECRNDLGTLTDSLEALLYLCLSAFGPLEADVVVAGEV